MREERKKERERERLFSLFKLPRCSAIFPIASIPPTALADLLIQQPIIQPGKKQTKQNKIKKK